MNEKQLSSRLVLSGQLFDCEMPPDIEREATKLYALKSKYSRKAKISSYGNDIILAFQYQEMSRRYEEHLNRLLTFAAL